MASRDNIQILESKAESGCIHSQLTFACKLYEGDGIIKDKKKSLRYFRLFYDHDRSLTINAIPNDFVYFQFMAYIALGFLNFNFIEDGKKLYLRVLSDAPSHLSKLEIQNIMDEFLIEQRLNEINLVEQKSMN